MDFRSQRTAKKLRRSLGVSEKDCDCMSVPGGAGNFEQLEKNLELSHRLHETRDTILTVHEDCGAGAKRLDLLRASEIAKKLGLKPRMFYLPLNGKWEEVVF
jgi:hypothetical protein